MAEDTNQQATPAGGAPEGEAPQEKSSSRLKTFLPLIIAVVLMPVMAIGTFKVKSMMDSKGSAEPKTEKAAGHDKKDTAHADEEVEDPTKTSKKIKRNTKVAVPLCRQPIAYKAKPDDKESLDTDKYVILDLKGDPKELAEAEKIVVNIARTGGTRYAVGRFSMFSEADNFVEQVNLHRERLIDVAHGALSNKTLDEIDTPGFKNVLRAELIGAFNRVFKANIVTGLNVELIVQ